LAAVVTPIKEHYFPKVEQEATKSENDSGNDYTEAILGTLQIAFMGTYMVIAPLFGWLADRVSRWVLIGIGVAVWSFASASSGVNWGTNLSLGFALLLLTRCFVGVGEAAYGPAAPTIISDFYPVRIRGSVLSWFYAAIPVGSALGYVLGGVMLKIAGQEEGWRWAFFVVMPPGLILALCCFFMREPKRGQADLEGGGTQKRARLRDALILARTPSYILVTLGMTAMTFALGGLAFWLPHYISERHGEKLDTVDFNFGLIVVISGLVATLLGGIAGDKLRMRFSGSYFLVSGFSMLVGFPMVLMVLWAPHPWYWVFIFTACFCLFFNTGPTNAILANVTHPSVRASAFAINILIIHALGDAISPSAIGLIKAFSSMEVGFIFVSLAILLGGLLWLWGTRYLSHDTAAAPTRLAL
jgi:MFS family permease